MTERKWKDLAVWAVWSIPFALLGWQALLLYWAVSALLNPVCDRLGIR